METIVNAAKNFVPQPQELPTLYSFDIFDTLIGRSCGGPVSVFKYVRNHIIKDGSYPDIVAEDYLKIRVWCERNVRELLDKTRTTRKSECREISFNMIFDHMADVYSLNAHQVEMLKQWELESEYAVSVPIQPNIDLIVSLLDHNETVILISDMYLPEAFVKDLLAKAEPRLANLPLFLSSTYGVQKTTRKLFLEAYHALDYTFGEWIHTGDNSYGDVQQAEKLGITAQKYTPTPFTDYERRLINYSQGIEMAQTAVLLRNNRAVEQSDIDVFAYSYAALLFVPYLDWVITDAVKRGIETLYFVSRDGDLLKKAADAIIDACGYDIRTKYIYGSRRSWRIPSFIEAVDDDFFSEYGNLIGAETFAELLDVLAIDEASLLDIHPEFKQLSQKDHLKPADVQMVRRTLQRSDKYKAYLLNYAKQERKVVLQYLTQEIDFSESFAFVEYWARGYTQTCLNRLLRAIRPEINPPMYYARSIYPSSEEGIRINFQTNTTSLIFVEFLFTNLPYSTTLGYQQDGEIVKPVFAYNESFRKDIYDAICNGVRKFSFDYCGAFPHSRSELNRLLFNFAMTEFRLRPEEPWFCNYIGPLQHTAAAAGRSSEFAPPITMKIVMHSLTTGEGIKTSSRKMTLARTSRPIRFGYQVAKRTKLWKHLKKFYANHLRKRN